MQSLTLMMVFPPPPHIVSSSKMYSETFNLMIVFLPLCTFRVMRHEYTKRGRPGHDRMVVRFTTTCAISAYH